MMSFADNVTRLWGREWNRPHKEESKSRDWHCQFSFPFTFSFNILLLISFLFSLLHRGKEPRCHTAKHDTRQPANSETSSETSLVRHDRLSYFVKPVPSSLTRLTPERLLNLYSSGFWTNWSWREKRFTIQIHRSAYMPDCLLFADKVASKKTVNDVMKWSVPLTNAKN